MVLVLYFILLIYGIYTFSTKKYIPFIIVTFIIISNCLGILPAPLPFKTGDIFILLLLYCLTNSKGIFNNVDKIGRYILYLLIYILINGIITIISGSEDVGYSIMVMRFEVYLLSYYIFRRIPLICIKKSLRILMWLTVISACLYYLQFLGINLLSASTNDTISIHNYSRLNNIPLLTDFMIFYLFLCTDKIRCKWILLLLLLGTVILSQNRGEILSIIICLIFYTIYNRNFKRTIKLTVISIIILLIFAPLLTYRFSSEGSKGEGIIAEAKIAYGIYFNNVNISYITARDLINSEGTGVFRAMLVKERMDYLFDSIISTIFGIGTIHEMSENGKKIGFNLGQEWDDGTIKQIDTSDVAFLSHILRYGFVYFIIFIYILILALKYSKKSNDFIIQCLFLLIISKLIQSINGDYFSGINQMFIVLLILPHIHRKSIQP